MVKVRVEKVARPGCAPCFVLDMICEGGVKHESHRSGGGQMAEMQGAGWSPLQSFKWQGGTRQLLWVGVRRGVLGAWWE
jgi:hypothetical protein